MDQFADRIIWVILVGACLLAGLALLVYSADAVRWHKEGVDRRAQREAERWEKEQAKLQDSQESDVSYVSEVD